MRRAFPPGRSLATTAITWLRPWLLAIALSVPASEGAMCTVSPPPGQSASAFDTLLRHHGGYGVTVCLGEGIYETEGGFWFTVPDRGFKLNRGWRIIGSGEGLTTVRLVGLERHQAVAFYGIGGNIEIAHLTVDGNHAAMHAAGVANGHAGVQTSAVNLGAGDHHWVHDITVTGMADETGSEGFPVFLGQLEAISTGNVFERITMRDWRGGLVTAILMTNVTNSTIRNNVVSGGYQIAYGIVSQGGGRLVDNLAFDVDYGVNIDTLDQRDTLIEGNIFSSRLYGVVVGGGYSFERFVIRNNVITLPAIGIGVVLQGRVTSSSITGNAISIAGGGTADTAVTIAPGNPWNTVRDNAVRRASTACECAGTRGRDGTRTSGIAVTVVGAGNERNAIAGNTVHYTGGACECGRDLDERRPRESP